MTLAPPTPSSMVAEPETQRILEAREEPTIQVNQAASASDIGRSKVPMILKTPEVIMRVGTGGTALTEAAQVRETKNLCYSTTYEKRKDP